MKNIFVFVLLALAVTPFSVSAARLEQTPKILPRCLTPRSVLWRSGQRPTVGRLGVAQRVPQAVSILAHLRQPNDTALIACPQRALKLFECDRAVGRGVST